MRLRASKRIELEAAVGGIGAGVDLEAEAEIGQVRQEELRRGAVRISCACRAVLTV